MTNAPVAPNISVSSFKGATVSTGLDGSIIAETGAFVIVRFIAINDNYDTIDPNSVNNDFAGIKNWFNEFYARDTSRILPAFQNLDNGTVLPAIGILWVGVRCAASLSLFIGGGRQHFIRSGAIFPGTHERIIDDNVFEKVQVIRQQRHRMTRTGRSSIFSGLVYCADCGSKMQYGSSNNGDFSCRFL